MTAAKKVIKQWLKKKGIVVSRYDYRYDYPAVRMGFFRLYNIDLVFDIGANTGQFARQLRDGGYKGRIVSFEPLGAAFSLLSNNALGDPSWEVVNCALGDVDGTTQINVSANSWSSSILNILPAHQVAAPKSAYVGKEKINIRTIDSIIGKYSQSSESLFLKIDVQGFGKKVLEGGINSIPLVSGIQMEMSLIPLYRNEPLLGEVVIYLYEHGYTLVAIQPEFFDPATAQQLQVNGLFFRMPQK